MGPNRLCDIIGTEYCKSEVFRVLLNFMIYWLQFHTKYISPLPISISLIYESSFTSSGITLNLISFTTISKSFIFFTWQVYKFFIIFSNSVTTIPYSLSQLACTLVYSIFLRLIALTQNEFFNDRDQFQCQCVRVFVPTGI